MLTLNVMLDYVSFIVRLPRRYMCVCVWTEALTFHMDILKYLCLNYSHFPSFVMSVSSVRGEGALLHTASHSFLLYSVFYVSVFLDKKGVSNSDGQMSQWTSRGRFFSNILSQAI